MALRADVPESGAQQLCILDALDASLLRHIVKEAQVPSRAAQGGVPKRARCTRAGCV